MCRRWMVLCSVLVACVAPLQADELASSLGSGDPALLGWWKLDELAGDIAADASGGANDGKVKGALWAKGIKTGALQFDGVNDYVAIQRLMYGGKGLPAVTVAAWVNTGSVKDQIIASFDRNEYWRLEINGDAAEAGRIGWCVTTDAGIADLGGRTRIDDRQWHHVAGVFDSGKMIIYVDGVTDATLTRGHSFGTGTRRYGFLGVGSKADAFDGRRGPESYFAGALDDVRIYSRALSRTEIEQLASRGPDNDDCGNAASIDEVTELPFDTRGATPDGPGLYLRGPNLWYRYTASLTGLATVSLAGSRFDTALAVYRGAECSPGRDRLLAYNDNLGDLTSQVTLDVTRGQTYLLEVGSLETLTGQGVLTVTVEPADPSRCDLGDAPDSANEQGKRMTAYPGRPTVAHFPTVVDARTGQPRGPIHSRPLAAAHLGPAVTLENRADQGPDEDPTNNINPARDEANKDGADDGVVLPLRLPNGDWAGFEFIVSAIEPTPDLWVNVWFDWNRDGDWDDDSTSNPEMVAGGRKMSEWAVRNQLLINLPTGTHRLMTPGFLAWHPAFGPAQIWMRVTLSEKPWKGGAYPGMTGNGGSGPAEGYDVGETEDYLVTPDTRSALCQDWNKDGQFTIDDLRALITEWLNCCTP